MSKSCVKKVCDSLSYSLMFFILRKTYFGRKYLLLEIDGPCLGHDLPGLSSEHVREWCKWPCDVRLMCEWSLWLTVVFFDVLHFAQNLFWQKISSARNRRTMFEARLARIIDTHCANMSGSHVSDRGMSVWCANEVGVMFVTHCCVLWCSSFCAKLILAEIIFCSKSTDHVWGVR